MVKLIKARKSVMVLYILMVDSELWETGELKKVWWRWSYGGCIDAKLEDDDFEDDVGDKLDPTSGDAL